MTPTDTDRLQLRRILNEVVPPGQTDAATDFPDVEIDELLLAADTVFHAAYWGWTRKAARYSSGAGAISETAVGSERVKRTSLNDLSNHALEMARLYEELATGSTTPGSRVMRVDEPDVLHLREHYLGWPGYDISRLA